MNNFTYLSNSYLIHQAYKANHKLEIFRIVTLCKNAQKFCFSDICFSLELICSVRLVHSTPLKDHFTETHSSHRNKYLIWLFQMLMTMFYPKLKKKKKKMEVLTFGKVLVKTAFLTFCCLPYH